MYKPDLNTIGGRIRYARTIEDLSIRKLAEQAGVPAALLRDVELGVKRPVPKLLDRICRVLDIDPDCLENGFPHGPRGLWPQFPLPVPSPYHAIQGMTDAQLAKFLAGLNANPKQITAAMALAADANSDNMSDTETEILRVLTTPL